LKFFILIFLLTIPFWVLGAMSGIQLLSGVPIAALAFVCPAIAATILECRENGTAGMRALLERSFDFDRIRVKAWYLPALLLYPSVVALSFFILRLTGSDIPDPQFSLSFTVYICCGFFISALGEEIGWSGYAIGPLEDYWGALKASLILGAVWAVWHWGALIQAHRSVSWIAWWSLYTVAARVIMVWLFNNTGRSVFAVTLFHMTLNVAWQLFPVNGSYFNFPVVTAILAIVVIIIVAVWEPRTLATYRYAQGNTCGRLPGR